MPKSFGLCMCMNERMGAGGGVPLIRKHKIKKRLTATQIFKIPPKSGKSVCVSEARVGAGGSVGW